MTGSAEPGELMTDTAGGIWVQDSGSTGPPVVLIHPGWGDSSIWDPLLAILSERHPGRLRCIRYDARGYGRSPAPIAPYTQVGDLTA
ncbi:MAG: alpha/beta fold hydrolase, partial [Actinomycetota bacterium]